MSSHKKCELLMNARALVREVFPTNGAKRLARLMGVPLDTAKHWMYRNLSNARRRELAEKLLLQLDEDDRRRDETRRTLRRIADGDDPIT